MRTLHADLTTSQAAAGALPYVRVEFTNRDGSTGRTYTTTDSPNHIVKVQQAEGRSDGRLSMPGFAGLFSMIIRLRDGDNSLSALDFKGMRVDIAWGFNTASGNKWSYGPPGFVVNQRTVSVQGTVFVEFTCISLWDIMLRAPVNLTSSAPVELSTTTIRHALMDVVVGDPGAVISDDGGALTDETADAIDSGANDVVLLPATPAVNDALYVGRSTTFNRVSIDMTTVGVGTWTLIWEYWNGSSWGTLTEISDDHDAGATSFTAGIGAFKTGELQTFAFVQPSDWATNTVNSQGPFFYVRARVSAFTSVTTQPLATKISCNMDFGLALDTSDSAQGDDYVPEYLSNHSTSRTNMVADLLGFTLLGMVARKNGLNLIYIDNAQGGNDFLYTSVAHNHYTSERSQGLIIPNKVIVVDVDPAVGTVTIEGSDEDTTSSAELGVIPVVLVVPGIVDGTAATLQAARAIKRALRDIQQGTVHAPMNCGQEIWDLVQVTDQRTGLSFTGRAVTILRTYIPASNVYNIYVQLGGAAAISTADYPTRIDLMNESERAATRAEMDARAALGFPPLTRRRIDQIVDERLAAMGLGFPEDEGIDLPPNANLTGQRAAVQLFRDIRTQAGEEGNFLSVSDAASEFITGLTEAMAALSANDNGASLAALNVRTGRAAALRRDRLNRQFEFEG